MFPPSDFHFTLDPSRLGEGQRPPRKPVPVDWKVFAAFLCLVLFVYGLWTKKIIHVMGFFELHSSHEENYWLQGRFLADFNQSPIRFILNMTFFGVSGAVLLIQLIFSYFQYRQRRK